jgi:hypothetical protein
MPRPHPPYTAQARGLSPAPPGPLRVGPASLRLLLRRHCCVCTRGACYLSAVTTMMGKHPRHPRRERERARPAGSHCPRESRYTDARQRTAELDRLAITAAGRDGRRVSQGPSLSSLSKSRCGSARGRSSVCLALPVPVSVCLSIAYAYALGG